MIWITFDYENSTSVRRDILLVLFKSTCPFVMNIYDALRLYCLTQ